jgi:hypothetical protein
MVVNFMTCEIKIDNKNNKIQTQRLTRFHDLHKSLTFVEMGLK